MAVTPLPYIEDLPYAVPITQAVYFLGVFVVIYGVGRFVVLPFVDRALKQRDVERHARKPLYRLVQGVIVFVAISVAFGAAGFGSFLSSLSTIAAAGTLAIGFAAQDLLANLVSGIFIYVDKPFKIGDWIEWDDYSGEVEDISLRVTRVRTFDNELLTVPNSDLANSVIKNPVDGRRLRLKFVFGIGYGDDIQRASEIIVEEAVDHPDIMENPEPTVRTTELADSYVGLTSRFWIRNPSRSDFVRIKSEYVTSVKERFDEEGIDIPFPQRTLGGRLDVAGFGAADATDAEDTADADDPGDGDA